MASQVGPGNAYSNERIGNQGGAKAHTPRQAVRMQKNKDLAQAGRAQPQQGGLSPLRNRLSFQKPLAPGLDPMLQSNAPHPARMLGRQFNEAVHRRVGGAEGMHGVIDNLATTYHNIQVYQAPGAYGYIHAIRQGLGPRTSDVIGAPKQEELALQRRWASQAGQAGQGQGNIFL